MILTIALTIGIGLAFSPLEPTMIEEPCLAEREGEYLVSLRDEHLKVDEPERLVHAIECLGNLKSIAAVRPLVSLMGYRRSFWWDGTGLVINRWTGFGPGCSGRQAFKALVKNLKEGQS